MPRPKKSATYNKLASGAILQLMKKPIYTQEQIEEMRKRLYDRSDAEQAVERHRLTDTPVDVSRDWSGIEKPKPQTTDLRANSSIETTPNEPEVAAPPPRKRRRYRLFILAGSFLIFILAALATSVYLYFGGNQISNANIALTLEGPALIGGGEVLPISVTVANNNSVPIESATLILKYPDGTRSAEDNPRNLYEERIPVEDIAPGQVQNIPVRVTAFGEEGQQRVIDATIEYRINGSNGMFYKDAEPLRFQISSSPLVLRVDAIEKVASGQTVEVTLTAESNASTPLSNILITADYPTGFRFEGADPEPVYGQNVWRIRELQPGGTETITLEGVVTGLTEETFRINLEAGPASSENQYIVGATLADVYADFTIERPFIDVGVDINNQGSNVVLSPNDQSTVDVEVTNTLDETVYDMAIEVTPSGNALSGESIQSRQGFYDSNRGTVRWETANNGSLGRVLPGETRRVTFTIVPGDVGATASFVLDVDVFARRVNESSAQETLVGTTKAEGRFESVATLGSQVGRNVGRFGDSGPTPPKVGEMTTYTLTVVAEAGENDMTNAVVETSLPVYVDWIDSYEAPGTVTYNSVNKTLEWNIGNIPAGERRELLYQVAITPSTSQVGRAPTLMNTQRLRATDRFTGSDLQDSAPAVTTELSTEMGFQEGNGEVVR